MKHEGVKADFWVVIFHLNLHGDGRVSILAMVIMGNLVEVRDIVRGVGQPGRQEHILHLRTYTHTQNILGRWLIFYRTISTFFTGLGQNFSKWVDRKSKFTNVKMVCVQPELQNVKLFTQIYLPPDLLHLAILSPTFSVMSGSSSGSLCRSEQDTLWP